MKLDTALGLTVFVLLMLLALLAILAGVREIFGAAFNR